MLGTPELGLLAKTGALFAQIRTLRVQNWPNCRRATLRAETGRGPVIDIEPWASPQAHTVVLWHGFAHERSPPTASPESPRFERPSSPPPAGVQLSDAGAPLLVCVWRPRPPRAPLRWRRRTRPRSSGHPRESRPPCPPGAGLADNEVVQGRSFPSPRPALGDTSHGRVRRNGRREEQLSRSAELCGKARRHGSRRPRRRCGRAARQNASSSRAMRPRRRSRISAAFRNRRCRHHLPSSASASLFRVCSRAKWPHPVGGPLKAN